MNALRAIALAALLLAFAGCKHQEGEPVTTTAQKIDLSSPAFQSGQPIAKRHSSEGENLSPPLTWGDLPAGTQELALICDDPDAPHGTWVHWVFYGIPAGTRSLPEGVPHGQTPAVPSGSAQGINSGDSTGYDGPMPPAGHGVHHYHFKLYALNTKLSLPPGATKQQLLDALKGHLIGQGELVGTYERK